MASQKRKQFSTVRYWRYVFTPLLLIGLLLGVYLLFTMPDSHTDSYEVLSEQVSKTFGPSLDPTASP